MASAAARSSVTLTDLPEDVVYEIVWYLGHEDQVNLASTHPKLGFLRPREQTVRGEDFTLTPSTGPETYMDVPILARGLTAAKMSFRHKMPHFWAQMWLRLMRDGEVIEENSNQDWIGFYNLQWDGATLDGAHFLFSLFHVEKC